MAVIEQHKIKRLLGFYSFFISRRKKELRMSVALNDFLIVGDPLDNFGVFLDLLLDFVNSLLFLVEPFGFDLAFGFKGGDNVLVLPADVM